jgi:hypothetical protein
MVSWRAFGNEREIVRAPGVDPAFERVDHGDSFFRGSTNLFFGLSQIAAAIRLEGMRDKAYTDFQYRRGHGLRIDRQGASRARL